MSTTMAVSTPVPALYEPGAPPPTLPLLTSQTDIFYNPLHSCTITAREELPPGQQTKRHQSLPPTPNSAGRVRFQSLPAPSNDNVSEDSDSSLTSLSSSDSESDSDELNEEDNKIGKPQGEAGRPGRGGYNLRVALGWAADDHKKLLDFVDRKVEECLDYRQCYMSQKPSSLGLVRQAAIEQFPVLDNYADCWPVNDMLMARLKTTSSKYRKRKREREGIKATEQVVQLKKKKKKTTTTSAT